MFSYGSGLASSLFLLRVEQNVRIFRDLMGVKSRLAQRIKISPEEYDIVMDNREKNFGLTPPITIPEPDMQ